MALDFLRHNDCTFSGPALPEPFVRFELEKALRKRKLLPPDDGPEGQEFRERWEVFRRKLRNVSPNSGPVAIRNRVVEPLLERLGYDSLEAAEDVATREGMESGGFVMVGPEGARLRCWTEAFDADLDSPSRRGHAYRYSPVRVAQRVLLAAGERVGLITNGVELRLLLSDPARPDSQIEINLEEWRRFREPPDSYRLLVAVASPAGTAALPDIVDQARLQQNRVTKELRNQARLAVENFIQHVLDHPDNTDALAEYADKAELAKHLWHEGLVIVYRLLFVLKCEATGDPSRAFSFAGLPVWQRTYSPTRALAPIVRRILDEGAQSGRYLEDGLRVLFRMFAEGTNHPELRIRPLGGALFGTRSAPLLSRLVWGEHAVAHLLDRLLWTIPRRGTSGRERVHYGPLDVEDLGRVYEALLELEPGIATEPMCRLKRQKLEVVVPVAQGEKYRPEDATSSANGDAENDDDDDDEDGDDQEEAAGRRKKTKVEWVEAIAPGKFYLRVGLGRKASGSYYTPHSFVRFLVQETLGPQCDERSSKEDPKPNEILGLKVLDPACGSGHFLVEACRFLGERLYEAARLCDEIASQAETAAEEAPDDDARRPHLDRAQEYRQRLIDIPDHEDELLQFLPSRAPEGAISGYSEARARAICKRLVSVHCLYGVDCNPLAVELAKLALWIESHAEGLPLTFLDHRIVLGNSLTGPFWEKLIFAPVSQEPIKDLFRQNLDRRFTQRLGEALDLARKLEADVGYDLDEIEQKRELKAELDRRMLPFRVLAAAWSGGVMLGEAHCATEGDDAYAELLRQIGETGDLPEGLESVVLRDMIATGFSLPLPGRDETLLEDGDDDPGHPLPAEREALIERLRGPDVVPALAYGFTFPEVFHPTGIAHGRAGFAAVIGNPPWDAIQFKSKEFFASFDFEIMNAPTKRERTVIERRLTADPAISALFESYKEGFEQVKRVIDALYQYQKVFIDGDLCGRQLDLFRVFMERNAQILGRADWTGVVVPSAFHANEGATGVRRLYLKHMRLRCCYSFENRRKLFEIDSRFKFALVVAQNGGATESFSCAFYLHDDEWLFGDRESRPPLVYTMDFVAWIGSDYLTFLELRRREDVDAAEACFRSGDRLKKVCASASINFSAEFHMRNDSEKFSPTAAVIGNEVDPRDPSSQHALLESGYLVLHEGKTFWHYDDHWADRPRYVVAIEHAVRRRSVREACCYYRLAYREVSSATNERTLVLCMLPAGVVAGHKAPNETTPARRPAAAALSLMAVLNSFPTDFLMRLVAPGGVSKFALMNIAVPRSPARQMLSHAALRLTCNHDGYLPLWREQLGEYWREGGVALTWPVCTSGEQRWALRAAIDAVVADAYGLSREQYEHVLTTFSHASYRRAAELCLAAFDDLKTIGLEAFCKKHDPYWDIPLNDSLPEPVIDLPLPDGEGEGDGAGGGAGAHLWQARDGQLTLESPGELFDAAADGGDGTTPTTAPAGRRGRRRSGSRRTAAPADARAYDEVAAHLRNQGRITSADAQGLLGLSASEVRPILKSLVDNGLAEKAGRGRGTFYQLKS